MNRVTEELLAQLECNPPASEQAIQGAARDLDVSFPSAYLELLRFTNGAKGFIKDSYVELWQVQELPERNAIYHVRDILTGVILIGSDGGGCALAIDVQASPPVFLNVPFIVMNREDILVLGPSIADLLKVFPPSH